MVATVVYFDGVGLFANPHACTTQYVSALNAQHRSVIKVVHFDGLSLFIGADIEFTTRLR